jgi:hypothetical protein
MLSSSSDIQNPLLPYLAILSYFLFPPKKEAEIIATLTATLQDEQTVRRYRIRAQDWSRQRTLTFLRVVTLILTGHKHALQNALNRFFRAVGLLSEVPTASAYSQARQKLQPAVFEHLNKLVVEKFYTLYAPDGGVKRWQGRRVIGIDGTMLNLPDTEALREHYTVHRNQHAGGSVCKRWAVCVMTCLMTSPWMPP